MDFGLYEKLLDSELKKEISKLHNETRKVDKSESARVLATAYYKILRKILSEKKQEEKIDFVRKLNKEIGNEIIFEEDKDFLELLAIHNDKNTLKQLINDRPKTSISSSTLFTGYTGPTLESELRREIRTADRIDFIVSFIKYSGLVLIHDDLVEFTRKKKLRIITTSYMGASDYKAILKLSQLPNTEVKISYDTNRTRLHAKAYYFERNSGFSTAYIGSSNISNPALSKGLEWNLKVSEYTSKDVVDSIIKTFETDWNDEEFRTFLPGNTLINRLEEFSEDKDVIIVTNVPGRFQRYTSPYARGRARKTIDNYIERLNPNNYDADVKTFFNFGNHSKIIMTDKMAYIGSANFSTQAELYYEDYYWSFFADSGHPHHGRGDEYRGFNANLSPVLVEKIESLSYEIEEAISKLNDDEIYPEIFEELDLNICEEVMECFGTDSQLEEFSRFDAQEKTYELFEEYLLEGDTDSIDNYAQMAGNDASEINMDLADEIYETALYGLDVLKRLNEFLIKLLKELEANKEINEYIDNT